MKFIYSQEAIVAERLDTLLRRKKRAYLTRILVLIFLTWGLLIIAAAGQKYVKKCRYHQRQEIALARKTVFIIHLKTVT
jgi:hypothetical protein